jgi:hypothetical protein
MRNLILILAFAAGAVSASIASVAADEGRSPGSTTMVQFTRHPQTQMNGATTQLVTPQTDTQKIAELQTAVAELQSQVETLQATVATLPPGDQIITRRSYFPGLHCDSAGTISADEIITRARVHIVAAQGEPDYFGATMIMPFWMNCHH